MPDGGVLNGHLHQACLTSLMLSSTWLCMRDCTHPIEDKQKSKNMWQQPHRPKRNRHQATDRQQQICDRIDYDHDRDLPRLIPLWPKDLQDRSPSARIKLLGKLRQALRQERRRGTSGHWTYSVSRHKALLDAYRCEARATCKIEQQRRNPS